MESKYDGPLLKLCGLWKQEKEGKDTFYSGKVNQGMKILVMKNKYKTEDSHPDLVVFLAKAEPRPDAQPAPAAAKDDGGFPF